MHYYQHHIGDFIRDTSRLSDEQCMAYLRMIWLYYESEQPLPNNPRLIAFRVGSSEDVVSLILESFFRLEDDDWKHTRCDSEIAEYEAICIRNRTNGKAGGRPKKPQSVSNGLPDETDTEPSRNPIQYPVTSNQEPVESKALVPSGDGTGDYSAEFEQFWKAYPRREGGSAKKGAFKAWKARLRSGVSADDLILSAKRYAEQVRIQGREGTSFVKLASTFLGPDEHWKESLASNVHTLSPSKSRSGRPALKPGEFYDVDWDDKNPSTHKIRHVDTHDPVTGYGWEWLKKQAWYRP